MSLAVWGVFKTRNAHTGLSGEGARLYGGRWTSPGRPVIYCAGHLSLAIFEILVHTERKQALSGYTKVKVEVAESQISAITEPDLPTTRKRSFPGIELQRIGDRWLASQRSLVLAIPSVIVPEEFNYLVNPFHSEFDSLGIGHMEPLLMDNRLYSEA